MRTWAYLALALSAVVGAEASDVAKLRRMMVDSRFIAIISPCKTGGTNRNNAAEWLRTAFHDAAAHDTASGTGGIDGSIQYELGYGENAGTALGSVIQQYKFYRQEGVSLADVVALGAIVAVGSCGGPMLPFYIGRTDARVESGEGFLPRPERSTESHFDIFTRMGMTRTEGISLVACGHTLGGVHASVHPTLTSEPYHTFDDTVAVYDNRIAIGHMNDTRKNSMGQPYDATVPERSSDARLFAADGNVTIRSYAESNDRFLNACEQVLSKMLNEAVPSSVTLTGPIVPFPVSATFRLVLRNEALTFSTSSARVYDMAGQWKSYEIGYTNRDGSIGTDALLNVRALRTLSIGYSAIVISLTLNDGTVFSSPEGEEVVEIDDTILIDTGSAYSCSYSGEANNNANGLNITMAVLGPYDAADNVEVVLRNAYDEKVNVRASFRRARDAYYNYYGAFIPDIDSLGVVSVGAMVTKANGKVSADTRDGETAPDEADLTTSTTP